MYDDLWVGGKCMYKLEPVLADGGELIVYAPHITEVSFSHGDIIKQIGYTAPPISCITGIALRIFHGDCSRIADI